MTRENGFFYCPVCGCRTALWQSDYDAEDVGYEQPGIVQMFTCVHCHAEIEAYTPLTPDEAADTEAEASHD